MIPRVHFTLGRTFAGLAALVLIGVSSWTCSANAQKVVTRPEAISQAKPQPVELSVQKDDGQPDPSTAANVLAVRVGNVAAIVRRKTGETLVIEPPTLDAGRHRVELLGSDGKILASTQLEYLTDGQGRPARVREEDRKDQFLRGDSPYVLVIVVFFLVMAPFALAITRATFPRRGSSVKDLPLGLPTGSFRAILAYTLVAYLGLYVGTSILTVSDFAPPEFLLGIVATVIGFYFGSRSREEGHDGNHNGTIRGIVRHGAGTARGVTVRFKRLADGTEPYSRVTDVDGRFELSGATPGKYKVYVSQAGGAASDEKEISVAEGSDHEIELAMKVAATPPATPQPGSIRGRVSTDNGSAASSAAVTVKQGGVEKAKAKANVDGTYQVDSVAPGDYKIVASLEGHKPSDEVDVKVTSGGQHSMDLKLKQ